MNPEQTKLFNEKLAALKDVWARYDAAGEAYKKANASRLAAERLMYELQARDKELRAEMSRIAFGPLAGSLDPLSR